MNRAETTTRLARSPIDYGQILRGIFMTELLSTSNRPSRASIKRLALASVAAIPLAVGLAAPAHAQIVNTATVTGTPDSGTLPPEQATESVTVALPIAAVNDTATGVNGATGDPAVLNVLTGDTLDGNTPTASEVDISVAVGSTVPSELTFDPNTGAVGVVAGTPAGTYSFDYTICEATNPGNCSTATVTVTVDPSPIVATNDTRTGVNGATGETGALNVLTGDTVNAATATVTNGILSVPATNGAGDPNAVPSELVFDLNDGSIDVLPGTPAGTYSFEYQICETLNPANCDTAVATITVDPSPIVATNDSASGIDGITGDTDALNVLTGDTVNGATATVTNGILSVPATNGAGDPNAVPSELTFDPATGTVGVVPGTLAGTYSFDYQICETLNPSNCDIATATVDVASAPSLSMTKVADDTEFVTVGQVITYTYTVTNDGNVVIRGVAVGDTHNAAGAAPTPTNETLLTDGGTAGDSTDAGVDGSWDVLAPGDTITFTGTYTVQQADIDNLQ